MDPKVLQHCRQMIRVGSKSFSLASYLFGSATRDAAHLIYGWCRFCDDEIDEATNAEEAQKRLEELNHHTREAVFFKGDFVPEKFPHPAFAGLHAVAKSYQIPVEYPGDLLDGMAMDVRNETYPDLDSLLLYCYRVAGVVGLMMTHVMGVSDERALKNAVDLGIAMQLTNIARDIGEDAKRGRVYLPQSWLSEAGLPTQPEELLKPDYHSRLFQVVLRLLDEADAFYQSGRSGLSYLPFRAALAVACAAGVYSRIGDKIRQRGEVALHSRTVVSLIEKIWVLLRSVFPVFLTLPVRMFRGFKPASIQTVWRYPS